jgi:hypothetical protein
MAQGAEDGQAIEASAIVLAVNMSRLFVCRGCRFQIKRFAGALPPERCPRCHSNEIVEYAVEMSHIEPKATTDPPGAFACVRSETCTRLTGGDCPGGKGC